MKRARRHSLSNVVVPLDSTSGSLLARTPRGESLCANRAKSEKEGFPKAGMELDGPNMHYKVGQGRKAIRLVVEKAVQILASNGVCSYLQRFCVSENKVL